MVIIAGAFVIAGVGIFAVLVANAIRTAIRGRNFKYPYEKGWPPMVKPLPPPPVDEDDLSIEWNPVLIHYAAMFRMDAPKEPLRAPESYPARTSDTWVSGPGPYSDSGNSGNISE